MIIRTLVTGIFCLSFLSCNNGDHLQTHLADYQSRMANVLDTTPVDIPSVSLSKYPSLDVLNLQLPDQTIKLFEFYQLKHCALYTLIAERNTSLGRLQLPSTRYLYERSLLVALQECIEQTANPTLKENLQQWYADKLQSIDASWANLMQSSSEIKRAISSHNGTIKGTQDDGLTQTKQALSYLVQINQNKFPEGTKLEQHLKYLNNSALPAKLWFSQLVLTEHLNYLTVWLTNNTTDLSCSSGHSKKKVEYLSNIFQLFFIEKIQPIAGQLNHYHYQLSPIFAQLTQHPDLSSAYKDYIQIQHFKGFEDYQKAMHQHIKFWQALFKRCDLSPQKTLSN